MRIMRTKIPSMHELQEGTRCIRYIRDAIRYRVEDLRRVLLVLSSTVARHVNLNRQLFSAETRSRETVRKLRFRDCGLFIISRTALPFDVLVL